MPTQLKELVVNTDGSHSQQVLPGRSDGLLGRRSRSDILTAEIWPWMQGSSSSGACLRFTQGLELHPLLQSFLQIRRRDNNVARSTSQNTEKGLHPFAG